MGLAGQRSVLSEDLVVFIEKLIKKQSLKDFWCRVIRKGEEAQGGAEGLTNMLQCILHYRYLTCHPLFLVHGNLLQYRGPWECWLPTVGREKEKTVFEMLRNIFYPQAALCPRLRRVRQPPH